MLGIVWGGIRFYSSVDEYERALAEQALAPAPGPNERTPDVCPEVWNKTKPDPERAMNAVRAMCQSAHL